MRKRYIVAIALIALVVFLCITWYARRKRKRTIDPNDFGERWRELQKLCASRKNWPTAIVEADNLLEEALKRSGYKGRTTGERLVKAQRALSDNAGAWFGHKLRNRIVGEDVRKLKKQDIISALTGFREALRDLGALHRD